MPRLTAADIPGYAEAVESETFNREVAYLFTDWNVCGIAVRPMTPAMLTELFAFKSPFLCGGYPTHEAVAHLLTVCSQTPAQRASRFQRWLFAKRLGRAVSKRKWGLAECAADIEQYVDAMFQDEPKGGGSSIPYASSAAWMEFTMAGEPWRWTRERTLATPIPIIYQQIRCLDRSRGNTPINPSDYVRAKWLDRINAQPQGLS